MTHSKTQNRASVWAFIGILVIGAIAITAVIRSSAMHSTQTPVSEEISERHKQLLSAQQEMSKWLLGLASGALVGVVGLRLKNPRDQSLVDLAPMCAYACLLLSLYAGFLSYETVFDILQRGPLSYFYGDALRAPVLLQFWTLMAALILLAGWLLRNRTRALMMVPVVALVAVVHPAHSQSLDQEPCLRAWYADRLHSPVDLHTTESLLSRIARLPGAKAPQRCEDLNSVLDSLRFAAVEAGQTDDAVSFAKYVQSLDDELSHPQLAMSDVVHHVLDLMQPWTPGAAVLSVRSAKDTCDILLQGVRVGLTNWDVRLAPGEYRIRVVRHGEVVFKADKLRLDAGQSKLIDVDHLP